MTLLNKILIGLLVVVLAAFGIFIFVKERQIATMQSTINSSLVAQANLIDNIQRSSATFATKTDLDNFAQQEGVNLAAIQKDLDGLNATISGVNVITVNSQGQSQTGVGSTSTTPNTNQNPPSTTVACNGGTATCPPGDTYGYTKNIQTLALNEDFANNVSVPFGSVSFDASQKKPWSETIYGRTYDITNTVGTNPNTDQMYVYNQLSITSNGKTQTIPISSSKFVQQVPSATFSWFNPHLMLGIGGGVNLSEAPVKGEATPQLGLQIMSYGTSKSNPTLSVLEVGAGYDVASKKPQVVLNPISVNIGKVIGGKTNIVDNTYIGPSIQVGTNGDVSAGLHLSVGL